MLVLSGLQENRKFERLFIPAVFEQDRVFSASHTLGFGRHSLRPKKHGASLPGKITQFLGIFRRKTGGLRQQLLHFTEGGLHRGFIRLKTFMPHDHRFPGTPDPVDHHGVLSQKLLASAFGESKLQPRKPFDITEIEYHFFQPKTRQPFIDHRIEEFIDPSLRLEIMPLREIAQGERSLKNIVHSLSFSGECDPIGQFNPCELDHVAPFGKGRGYVKIFPVECDRKLVEPQFAAVEISHEFLSEPDNTLRGFKAIPDPEVIFGPDLPRSLSAEDRVLEVIRDRVKDLDRPFLPEHVETAFHAIGRDLRRKIRHVLPDQSVFNGQRDHRSSGSRKIDGEGVNKVGQRERTTEFQSTACKDHVDRQRKRI